jgi:hypothetical protein
LGRTPQREKERKKGRIYKEARAPGIVVGQRQLDEGLEEGKEGIAVAAHARLRLDARPQHQHAVGRLQLCHLPVQQRLSRRQLSRSTRAAAARRCPCCCGQRLQTKSRSPCAPRAGLHLGLKVSPDAAERLGAA